MASERLNILLTAFHTAKLKGLHNNITPAPESIASELLLGVGLLKLDKKVPWQEDQGFLLARSAKSWSVWSIWLVPSYSGKNGLSARLLTLATPILGVQTNEMHFLVPTSTPSHPNSPVS